MTVDHLVGGNELAAVETNFAILLFEGAQLSRSHQATPTTDD